MAVGLAPSCRAVALTTSGTVAYSTATGTTVQVTRGGTTAALQYPHIHTEDVSKHERKMTVGRQPPPYLLVKIKHIEGRLVG